LLRKPQSKDLVNENIWTKFDAVISIFQIINFLTLFDFGNLIIRYPSNHLYSRHLLIKNRITANSTTVHDLYMQQLSKTSCQLLNLSDSWLLWQSWDTTDEKPLCQWRTPDAVVRRCVLGKDT